MSYSTFFRLGLSLACEPKDYAYTYSYPLSPVTPTTPTPQLQISIQTPVQTQQRSITRRRRSSLTILTPPMNTVKSTNLAIRAASEATVRVVRSSELEVNVVAHVLGETENVPPASGPVRKIRRKTVTSPPPILLSFHHRIPAPPSRFPPPTSPLPPTPLSPSFATWSQKNLREITDPVLPQTPTRPSRHRHRVLSARGHDQASAHDKDSIKDMYVI